MVEDHPSYREFVRKTGLAGDGRRRVELAVGVV